MDSYTKKGYKVTFEHDTHAWSPDEWGCDVAFIIAGHRDFTIARKGFPLQGERNPEYDYFPLYAYIHSGVALSMERSGVFTCGWDSCQVGYVLVKKDPVFRLKGTTTKDRGKLLIDEWNSYLIGDVWYVTITDSRGDEIESAGGIVGREYAEEYAEGVIGSLDSCEEWTEVQAIEHMRACLQNLYDRNLIQYGNDHIDEVKWVLEKTQYWAKKEVLNG